MIVETGKIVAIECDALWVEMVQQTSCRSCSARKACGQGLMNTASDGRRNRLRVPLENAGVRDFSIGEDVEVAIPESVLLGAAALVYLLPLVTLLVGMAIANALFGDGPLAATGAILGFLAGLVCVRAHAALVKNRSTYHPTLLPKPDSDVGIIAAARG